jgi:hypothetical protein
LIEVLTRVHNMLEVRLLQKEIADHKEDNPALSNVIQRNIRKIIHVRNDEESDHADADLEMETKPEDVLAEIERLQRRAMGVPRERRQLR